MNKKKWILASLLIAVLIIPTLVSASTVPAPEDDTDVELTIRNLGPAFIAKNNGDKTVRLIATVTSNDEELFHEEEDLTPGLIWMTVGRPTPFCIFKPITATLSAGSQTVVKNGFQFLFWAVVF